MRRWRARSVRGLVLWALLGLGLLPGAASAWNNHALCTWQALEPLQELATLRVRAELLESFLAAQAPQLARVLAEQEAWARAHNNDYAPRPDALAFAVPQAGAAEVDLRQRFLKALRLNVSSRLPLFLQLRPGDAPGARPVLPWQEVTTLASGVGARENTYVAVAPGQELAVSDVLATASHEPDYGLDLGLFEDNGTAHGRSYGFGAQPFGNAALEYSSQVPFHMGFYHEARIVFAAGGFLRRTHPEARIALFMALSRLALASGHVYWGWRFAGWALHYVQDLAQPYHARVLPGVNAARMLGMHAVAMAGWERPKHDAITMVSNRHTVVEDYQQQHMTQAYLQRRMDDVMLAALRDTGRDRDHWRYELANTRALVSRESFEAADALDRQLEKSFPRQFTADPSVTLGNGPPPDMPAIAQQHSAEEHARLEQMVAALLGRVGLHTRAVVRELLGVRP